MAEKAKKNKINLNAAKGVTLIAKKGCALPVLLDGKKVVIGDEKEVPINVKQLGYEGRIEIKRAIDKGDLIIKGESK